MVLKTKKIEKMDGIDPSHFLVSDKEKLPLVTCFMLFVDAIALFNLGMKREGRDKVTDGDIVISVVLITFTIFILVLNFSHFLLKRKRCDHKQVLYGLIEKKNVGNDCAICLESTGHTDGQIQCGHVFHKSCINSWMNKYSSTCPLCRTQLVYIITSRFPFNVQHFIKSLLGRKGMSIGNVCKV